VTLATTSATSPDFTQLRIVASATEQGIEGPSQSRVEKDGTFSIRGVAAGPHLIRAQGGLRGWVLESVTVGGRETTDTPLDLRTGESLANVIVSLTDKISQISGTLTSAGGAPVVEYTVLAFPTDSSLWNARARQIMTARPDQTGKYTLRGLPPGEYYVVTVDPAEQGEWFEPAYLDAHRTGASRVRIAEGDAKTHDFVLHDTSG
jgi:hypothetical protein